MASSAGRQTVAGRLLLQEVGGWAAASSGHIPLPCAPCSSKEAAASADVAV